MIFSWQRVHLVIVVGPNREWCHGGYPEAWASDDILALSSEHIRVGAATSNSPYPSSPDLISISGLLASGSLKKLLVLSSVIFIQCVDDVDETSNRIIASSMAFPSNHHVVFRHFTAV